MCKLEYCYKLPGEKCTIPPENDRRYHEFYAGKCAPRTSCRNGVCCGTIINNGKVYNEPCPPQMPTSMFNSKRTLHQHPKFPLLEYIEENFNAEYPSK